MRGCLTIDAVKFYSFGGLFLLFINYNFYNHVSGLMLVAMFQMGLMEKNVGSAFLAPMLSHILY